ERHANVGEALEVVLEASRPIEGRVVDDRDAAIPFASVRLIPAEDDTEEPLPPTWCDVEGRFTVFPDRDVPMIVVAEAPGHFPEWPPPRAAAGGRLVLHLPRTARLVVERDSVELAESWTVDVGSVVFPAKRVPANTTSMWMEVEAGLVECSVTLPGHEPFLERIVVPPGETRVVRVVP